MATLCLLLASLLAGADGGPPRGRLLVHGGGGTSDEFRQKALDLAGGKRTRVLVIPQAAGDPPAGPESATAWKKAGAGDVRVLDLGDPKAAIEAIRGSDLIWIGGGDQQRLMDRLKGTGIPEAIRERYHSGALVGGTSAGAAVMSKVMIAGYEAEPGRPEGQRPRVTEGLGLWPGVIVDQHFLRRNRIGRLKLALQAHPRLVGVGIDEKTAVLVQGPRIEVFGVSDVIVLDPRSQTDAGPAQTTLKPGMTHTLDAAPTTPEKP